LAHTRTYTYIYMLDILTHAIKSHILDNYREARVVIENERERKRKLRKGSCFCHGKLCVRLKWWS